MYPEDRVLIAYVPSLKDFERIQQDGWYRIPQTKAPKGLHAEYIGFYFGRQFGDKKWAIHHYAENRGHELVRRIDLIPSEPDHPRANDAYYKIQLGPVQTLDRPIVSLNWRRLLFIHTTWDRFQTAVEVNDLMMDGDELVNRKFSALNEPRESRYSIIQPGDSDQDSDMTP